jgi:hypothetical protein
MLELQLSKKKAVMKESKKERGRLGLNLIQSSFELKALRYDFNDCQEDAKYNHDKFIHVQAKLVDKIEKYKGLNKKCLMMKS